MKKDDEIKQRLKEDFNNTWHDRKTLFFLYGIKYSNIIISNKIKPDKSSVISLVKKFLKDTEFENKKKYIHAMADGIMYSDLLTLSDEVYKIKIIHWIATLLILIGSILLFISLWGEITSTKFIIHDIDVTNIIFLIGLICSNISTIFELFNIHLIKINTLIGKTLSIINISILVSIFLMEVYPLFLIMF